MRKAKVVRLMEASMIVVFVALLAWMVATGAWSALGWDPHWPYPTH